MALAVEALVVAALEALVVAALEALGAPGAEEPGQKCPWRRRPAPG